ncbi:hypothetical protein N7467_001559 [Penicillium canescens]|nr:hypothetical protein N7467_001559 [Penicillium canescens]
MVNLFQELHSWNHSLRLKLDLGVRGRRGDPAPEPYTKDWDVAGEYLWDYKDGRRFSTPPYRARFLNDTPDLASVPCVEKLYFINENWPGGTIYKHVVQVLDYEGEKEENWKQTLSLLNVIYSRIDNISINLRDRSVNLRELKFKNSAIAYDFMCPLDGEGKPEPGSLH